MKIQVSRLLVIISGLFVVNIALAESLPLSIPVAKATLLKGGYTKHFIQSGMAPSNEQQDAMRYVDIAFFYTPDLLEELNREEIQAYIEEQTGFANLALENNNIENLRRRVLYVGEIDIPGHTALSAQEVARTFSLHDDKVFVQLTYGNDHNTLVRPRYDQNLCGTGAMGDKLFSGEFSVLEFDEQCNFPSLAAHEWGHGDGMAHDITNANLQPDEPFGYGYHCDGQGTIMNSALGNHTRHSFYSSPNILVNGLPCGVEEEADNARLLRLRMQQATDGARVLDNSGGTGMPIEIYGEVYLANIPELNLHPYQGTLTLTLARNGELEPESFGNPQPTSVEFYTKAISAIPGQDYEITIQRVEFEPGQEFVEVDIPLLDDPRSRNTVQFEVGLRYPLSLEVMSAPVIVNLLSERPFTGNAAFTASTQNVTASSTSLTLTVNRTGTTEGELTIPWFIDDVNTTSADYSPGSGELVFADGEDSKTIELELPNPNQTQERQFKVVLDSADAIAPSELLVTIAAATPAQPDTNSGGSSDSGGGGGSLGVFMLFIALLGLRRRQ